MSKYGDQKYNLSLKLKDVCRPYPPLEEKTSKASQPPSAFESHRKKTNVEEAKYVYVDVFKHYMFLHFLCFFIALNRHPKI